MRAFFPQRGDPLLFGVPSRAVSGLRSAELRREPTANMLQECEKFLRKYYEQYV